MISGGLSAGLDGIGAADVSVGAAERKCEDPVFTTAVARVSALAPVGMRSVTVCLPDVLVTANTGESP